jgi:hypothetical protein
MQHFAVAELEKLGEYLSAARDCVAGESCVGRSDLQAIPGGARLRRAATLPDDEPVISCTLWGSQYSYRTLQDAEATAAHIGLLKPMELSLRS